MNPDSLITMARQWAAKKLDVAPEPGTFWCIACVLNDGCTLIGRSSNPSDHAKMHVLQHDPSDKVNIRISLKEIPG